MFNPFGYENFDAICY